MLDLSIDVKENELMMIDPMILHLLLQDKTTGKNLIWATDDYVSYGNGFQFNDEITVEKITGDYGRVIMPRSIKSKETQSNRTRNMAEVFTPTWICNKMNNLVDESWFGRSNVFNKENNNQWELCLDKVVFPDFHQYQPKGWESYIGVKRLEITCGEAPYLVSRYDTVTGEAIPVESRVGILDRKFRIINERTVVRKDKQKGYKRWLELAKKALQSTYGFEWQGDNVLLARENLLYTVMDYFYAKFGEQLPQEWLPDLVKIISWNIWQMDGLKCVIPNSCHDYKKQPKAVEPSLFDTRAYSVSVLKRSIGFCDVNEEEIQKCQGCLKDNIDLHNGLYCKIKNWSTGQVIQFKDLFNGQGSESSMSKKFKFDVIIGNPPYQVEDGGNAKSAKPVYHYFVNEARKLQPNYISLIIPSRWYAGGKGLDDFRISMLNDTRIKELHDCLHPEEYFPNTNNRGGICYFFWDKMYDNSSNKVKVVTHDTNHSTYECMRPLKIKDLDIFIRNNKAISILEKVILNSSVAKTMTDVISPRKPFGIEGNFVSSEDFHVNKDNVLNPIKCYGKAKSVGYMSRNLISSHTDWIDAWKVFMPYANNIGTELNDDNQNSFVVEPGSVCTETFLSVGAELNLTKESASNLSNYLRTKFARFLLSLAKISQHGTSKTYMFVPIQDFSKTWTDNDLYKKYKLSNDEIDYIESTIKPMD